MDRNELLVNTLNSLLCINCDRARGYENAIEKVGIFDNIALKKIFKQHAELSREYAAHWEQTLRSIGIEPVIDPYRLDAVFRGWVDFTTTFSGHTCKSLLHYCARGEKSALDAYKEILRSVDFLPDSLQDDVRQQKTKIYAAQVSIVTMAIYATTFERIYSNSAV